MVHVMPEFDSSGDVLTIAFRGEEPHDRLPCCAVAGVSLVLVIKLWFSVAKASSNCCCWCRAYLPLHLPDESIRDRSGLRVAKACALLFTGPTASQFSSSINRPGTRKLSTLVKWRAFPAAPPLQPNRRNSAVVTPSRLLLAPRVT